MATYKIRVEDVNPGGGLQVVVSEWMDTLDEESTIPNVRLDRQPEAVMITVSIDAEGGEEPEEVRSLQQLLRERGYIVVE